MGGRKRGPAGVTEPVDFGTAELRPDADRPGGWLLVLDGHPQSYVDVDNARHLEFGYIRRLASVIDLAAPSATPLSVLHLGGGALTLPRYVALTRPKSAQRVVERDAALIELVRRVLPLPRGVDLRVRAEDARVAVDGAGAARFDLVICDVYGDARVPGRVATVEFAASVARVLRPNGIYAANLADGAALDFARAQVATLRTAFTDVCLMAEPSVLRGRRFGNVVLVAAQTTGRLPVTNLAAAGARDPLPAQLMHGADLEHFASGAKPATDATAVDSPAPPTTRFK